MDQQNEQVAVDLSNEIKIAEQEIRNIVFQDGKGNEFLRLSKDKGIVLNREVYGDWQPDDFVQAFIDTLEKQFEILFKRKEQGDEKAVSG